MQSYRMAKVICVLALALSLCCLAAAGTGGKMATPEERADRISKALNLTDDQKAKVLSIYQDEQKQMSDLKTDTSLSDDARHDKMKQIHQSSTSKIKDLLSADQAQKFDAMEQKMKESHEGKGKKEHEHN